MIIIFLLKFLNSWPRRLTAGICVIGVGACAWVSFGLLGAGALATFTSTGQTTITAPSGQLQLQVLVNTSSMTISNIAPDDVVYRPLSILLPKATSAGNLISKLAVFTTTTADAAGTDPAGTATSASLKSGTNGLTYKILTCSQAWTAASNPGSTDPPYTCGGSLTNTTAAHFGAKGAPQLGSLEGVANKVTFGPADFGLTPVAGTGTFASDTANVNLDSMLEVTLPHAADNGYQRAAWTFSLTVAAIQRDGTNNA